LTKDNEIRRDTKCKLYFSLQKSSFDSVFEGLDYDGETGNKGKANMIKEVGCHGRKGLFMVTVFYIF
jgi:hypothetical protein